MKEAGGIQPARWKGLPSQGQQRPDSKETGRGKFVPALNQIVGQESGGGVSEGRSALARPCLFISPYYSREPASLPGRSLWSLQKAVRIYIRIGREPTRKRELMPKANPKSVAAT
jgi:hypothetical protein